MMVRQETKILATLGTASQDMNTMRALIREGASGFRINMGHTKTEDLAARVRAIRAASSAENTPIAIVVDLGGPKIRVGALPGKQMKLSEGAEVVLGKDIPLTIPEILRDIEAGQRILLDDGKLELSVVGADPGGIKTRVKVGGLLLQGKGINLPDTNLNLPALTLKDQADLAAAVRAEVDYVSLSFVQTAEAVNAARKEAKKHGQCPHLIAKIEKPQAVDRFEAILKAADGIMVARGDLGVEMSPAKVPVLQKRFIRQTNAAGKTVITATQMLESMIENPRPTRAEASDVANAVWDGTDAVMLSGETAIGRYPVETVRMMRSIIAEAEKAAAPRREPFHGGTRVHALASAAVRAAEELHAKAIIIITVSGFTAQMVAQLRPTIPMIAVVPEVGVQNRLALLWGTTPLLVPWESHSDEFLDKVEKMLLQKGYIQSKDIIVLVSGSTRLRGADYLMKIHEV